MSDLGLKRYLGYSALPAARALLRRLEREQPAHLANGVHLINSFHHISSISDHMAYILTSSVLFT